MSEHDTDFVKLVEALRLTSAPHIVTPPASEERGLAKHASTVIVVIAGALCVWVGSTLTGLSTQVTQLTTTMQAVSKASDDIRSTQGQTAKDVSDLREIVSRDDQRIGTNEQRIQSLSDRMRIVEGQPPLPPRQTGG